jgi:hypothetical protein
MKNRITPIFVNRWLLIMLFFVSIIGCKKSDEPVGIIGLCPEVTVTDPMLNAVDVELEKTISMKKVLKHYPRKHKYSGLAKINYDNF